MLAFADRILKVEFSHFEADIGGQDDDADLEGDSQREVGHDKSIEGGNRKA